MLPKDINYLDKCRGALNNDRTGSEVIAEFARYTYLLSFMHFTNLSIEAYSEGDSSAFFSFS